MIKYLNENEKHYSRVLYEEIFKDSKEFTDFYYDGKAKSNRILADVEDDRVVSMLHRSPKNLIINGLRSKADYVFAVATAEDYRRSGRMESLLRRSLNDMYQEGLPLAYLVPVDPKVYLPYGFEFVYSSPTITEKKTCCTAGGMCLSVATQEDIDELADFATIQLSSAKKLYISRTPSYFVEMINQMKAENGFLAVMRENNKVCAYAALSNDDFPQISEFVCPQKYREFFINETCNRMNLNEIKISGILHPWKNCYPVPKVMSRIICLESAAPYIRTRQRVELILGIVDPVIRENNHAFRFVADNNSCDIIRCSQKPDIVMGTGDFASWFMNGRAYSGMPEILGNTGVFLNEIV